MWCPQCKNEYRAGITKCADCGCELVEKLVQTNTKKQERTYYFEPELADPVEEDPELVVKSSSSEETQRKASYTYVTMRTRYEDNKSSAWTFFIIGGIGLIAIILHAVGIINFSLSSSSKLLTNIVMGGLFVIFLVIGVFTAKAAAKYKLEAAAEEEMTENLIKTFKQKYSKDDVDLMSNVGRLSGLPDAAYRTWLVRYAFIRSKIQEQCKGATDEYLEYIVELIYGDYYESDSDKNELN